MKNDQYKRCPSCDKDISVKAKKCPYCQSDLRSWFRRHPILTFIGILFLAPFVLSAITGSSTSNSQSKASSSPEPEKKETFKADVRFTGTQFVISNLEDKDCMNSKVEVNGGFLKDGYSLDGYLLEAGNIYTVGAAQFTDKDGNRFNTFSKKPQSLSISCRGNNELSRAVYYGEF